jgi:pimeloyl-ACP methyl ester carboxylesterase
MAAAASPAPIRHRTYRSSLRPSPMRCADGRSMLGGVYLVGYSNGGKLAYSAVCAHPKLFAAVATYGAVPLSPCAPGTSAVSVMLTAGAADQVLPFPGKPGGHPPLPSVPQAVSWPGRLYRRCSS